MEVFPTGLRGVDEDLHHGGIPAGSVVGFEYPRRSAGEAVLWTLVARGLHPDVHHPLAPDETTFVRPDAVHYLTTRPHPDLADALAVHTPDRTADELGLPLTVERLDVGPGGRSAGSLAADALAADATRPAVVLDSLSDLVAFGADEAALDLVSAVRERIPRGDGIAYLTFTARPADRGGLGEYLAGLCDGHLRFDPGEGAASAALEVAHLRDATGPVDGFPAVFDLQVNRRVSVDTVERG